MERQFRRDESQVCCSTDPSATPPEDRGGLPFPLGSSEAQNNPLVLLSPPGRPCLWSRVGGRTHRGNRPRWFNRRVQPARSVSPHSCCVPAFKRLLIVRYSAS